MKGKGRHWTEEEVNFLQDNYKKGYEYISKKLNRSIEAVKIKSVKLNLGMRIHSNPDYITFHKLLKALGYGKIGGAVYSSLPSDFPIYYYKTESKVYRMVNIKEFWNWASKNKHFFNFSNMRKNILGIEPDWVDKKRKADKTDPSKTNHNKKWTKEDDSLLISKCKSNRYTYAELSKELNRTECAIKKRLQYLKVPYRPIPLNTHIKWTQEENEKLIELFNLGLSSYSIAIQLCKSQHSIKDRINLLLENKNSEIKKKIPWTEDEMLFLKNNWSLLCVNDIALKLNKSYYSVMAKASRLELGLNPNGKK